MENVGLLASGTPLPYFFAEQAYVDPNYRSSSPYGYDEAPVRRVHPSEISYTDILNELGNGIWNFFSEGLKVIGDIFSGADAHPGDAQIPLQPLKPQLDKKFSSNLNSVSSIQHTDGKKLTAHLYNRKQLIAIFEQIKNDIDQSNHLGELSDELAVSLDALKKRSAVAYLSVEEKAIISLSFQQLVDSSQHILQTKRDELTLREQFVTTIIGDLNEAFEYWARESLAEKIKVELAQEKQTKLGQLHSKSTKVMAGVTTPFSQLGTYKAAGIKGSHDRFTITDAERFRNKYDLYLAGGYVEGAVGLQLPELEDWAKAQVKLTADLQLMGGSFKEPKTAMDEVTRDFEKLIHKKKYRHKASIARYLARARVLNLDVVSDFDEVADIEQIRLAFNKKKASIDARVTLYMTSQPNDEARLAKTDIHGINGESNQPTWASTPVKVAAGDVTEAVVIGAVGKISFGGEAKAEVNVGVDTIGISAGIGANMAAYTHGELMARNRSEVKRTLIGLRYVDATKSAEEKASIKQQVKTQFNEVKKALLPNIKAKELGLTDLGIEVLSWARGSALPDKKYFDSDEKYQEALKTSQINISDFSEFLQENKLDSQLVNLCSLNYEERRNYLSKLGNPCLTTDGQKNIDFNIKTKEDLKQHINFLKQELQQYTALCNANVGHKQEFPTQGKKQAAIRAFEKRYGAASREELVHSIHVACLYLLTNIAVEKAENDQVVDDLLQLEKELSRPLFAVNKAELDDRLYFLEDLNITLYQAQLEVESKAGLSAHLKLSGPLPGSEQTDAVNSSEQENGEPDIKRNLSISAGVNGKSKVSMFYNYLSGHRNILRKGHSVLFSVTLGVERNVEGILRDVTKSFNQFLPADIAQEALGELKEKLLQEITATASWTDEVTFDFYLAKPNQLSKNCKGFSLSPLFSRTSKTEIADSTFKKTIGLSTYTAGLIPFDLVAGGGSMKVETEPTVEITEPGSILQYSIQYNHAYDVEEIDKVTGEVQEDCYVYEFEQQPELDQFFKNRANEEDDGAISSELDELETAVNDNPNYLKQLLNNFQNARRASTDTEMVRLLWEKIAAVRQAIEMGTETGNMTSNDLDGVLEQYNFQKVRQKLKEAAQDFSIGPTNTEKRNQAVASLRALQHAFNPHYLESKSNSPDLRPRPLTPINTTASRLMEAKARLAGMTMPYGFA